MRDDSSPIQSSLQIWRGFFPSWKFFDEVGWVPHLLFRTASSEKEIEKQDWQPVLRRTRRRWFDLFFNPHGNLLLFTDTIVRQFVDDVQAGDSPEQIEHAVSFKLIQNLVQKESLSFVSRDPSSLLKAHEFRRQREPYCYQFKVAVLPLLKDQAQSNEYENIMISSVYKVDHRSGKG